MPHTTLPMRPPPHPAITHAALIGASFHLHLHAFWLAGRALYQGTAVGLSSGGRGAGDPECHIPRALSMHLRIPLSLALRCLRRDAVSLHMHSGRGGRYTWVQP